MGEWQKSPYKCKRPSKCVKFTEKQFAISTKMYLERGKIKHFNGSGLKGGRKCIPNNRGGGKTTWETGEQKIFRAELRLTNRF